MDGLIGFFVGAGAALTAQTLLQLLVIPRVEARKRRLDRWEKDVLRLAELVATANIEPSVYMIQIQSLLYDLSDNDRSRAEASSKRTAALEGFPSINEVEVSWLTRRIVGSGVELPNASKIGTLSADYLSIAGKIASAIRGEGKVPDEEFAELMERYGKVRPKFLDALESLAADPALPRIAKRKRLNPAPTA